MIQQDRIIETLGRGVYGNVVKAVHVDNERRIVAIKIGRSLKWTRKSTKIEIRMLSEVKKRDPNRNKYVYSSVEFV